MLSRRCSPIPACLRLGATSLGHRARGFSGQRLRHGELFGLTWLGFSAERRTLRIEQQVVPIRGGPAILPRDKEFLFSRNRLNVALSRAQCLAYIVASPELLNTRARTVDQMKLISTVCAAWKS